MLKVWGRRSSFNVQKVMWLIGELGLAHEHIDAGGAFGGLDTPDFLAMNPHGRVPVIRDELATVWDRTRSFATLPLATMPGVSDPTIPLHAPPSMAGWTGRKLRCSRISWSACSGDSIERPRTSGIGRRSAPHWPVAPGISRSWSDCSSKIPSCSAIRCRLPILLPARRCTDITNWKSSGRRFPRWNAGIGRCSNAKRSGSTS
jgi:hypothetical protein